MRKCFFAPSRTNWLPELDNSETEPFIVTVDSGNCKINEICDDPNFPFNRQPHSHKFKSAAWKCKIAVATHSDNMVWVNGPWKGEQNDMFMSSQGQEEALEMGQLDSLLQLVAPGKFICDQDCIGFSDQAHLEKAAFEHNDDLEELKEFKACACGHHETVNERIKQHKNVSQVFCHSEIQHELAFKAICLVVQCYIDLGISFPLDSHW